MRVVFFDTNDEERAQDIIHFSIDKSHIPTYMVDQQSGHIAYLSPKTKPTFQRSELKQFLSDILSNNIEAYIRSQEIPAGWDEKPVKVLVGKNVMEVISKKDAVLLLMCKSLKYSIFSFF